MSVNVPVTPGSGKIVGADEVVDGVLGTVQIQYVKIMDGTIAGSTKAGVGANGLKVDPSGVTQTVNGNVNASQSGTWIVQPGNTPNTVAWKVDGSAVTQPISGAVSQSGNWSVRNQDGAGNLLTSATRGVQQALSVQIVDASGNQITSFGGAGGTSSNFGSAFPAAGTAVGVMNNAGTAMTNMSVNASGALKVDGSAVTQPVSGTFWQATQPVSLTSTTITGTVAVTQSGAWTVGQSGTWSVRMQDGSGNGLSSAVRGAVQALSTQLVDGSGNQIGIATAPIRVDPTGTTTQPVSGTVAATQSGNWTSRVVGNAGAIMDAAQNAAAPANELVVGGVYNSAAPTLTSGNASQLQLDASGNLNVNIKAGAGSGGTASTFGSAFPSTGTAVGAKDSAGTNMQPLNLDASGNLKVNVAAGGASGGTSSSFGSAVPATGTAAGFSDGTNMQLGHVWDGDSGAGVQYVQGVLLKTPASGGAVDIGVSGQPLRVDPTGTTTQPVSIAAAVTVQQSTAANLNATVTGTVTVAQATAANLKGQVDPLTIGTWGLSPATQNTASPTNDMLVAGQFNTTPTTITTGNSSPLQLDSSANLLVNVKTGTVAVSGISGTVSLPTGAATAANQTNVQGVIGNATAPASMIVTGGVFNTTKPTLTTGQSAAFQSNSSGSLLVDGSAVTQPVSGTVNIGSTVSCIQSGTWNVNSIQSGNWSVRMQDGAGSPLTTHTVGSSHGLDTVLVDGSGNQIGISAAPLRVDPTGTTTQPVSIAAAVSVNPGTAANWGISSSTFNTAAPASAVLVEGQYISTQAVLTTTNTAPLQVDKVGRLLAVGALRTLKGVQKTSISVATETTVVTAGAAGVFNDVYAIVVTNKSATSVFVDFKDATAGTVRMTLAAPANDTRGFTVPVDSAMVQAVAANNWTATVSSAVSSIEITMLYTSNL